MSEDEREIDGIDDSSIYKLFEELGGSLDDLPPPKVLTEEEIDEMLARLFPEEETE